VALKSIVAYRSGLRLERTSEADAAEAFGRLKKEAGPRGPVRLEDKRLLDYCIWTGVELAGSLGLPIQLHTGFGDSDLDLRESNPLHLRPLLEDGPGRSASIVLLHAGYPFCREAGYLASLYANVYVGISLAVPMVQYGAVSVLEDLLGLAPWSKLLYGSDGYTVAESYWWGALHGREALAAALEGMVSFGSLSGEEALGAARAVLKGNAEALYGLGG
jgi:predicted TIM-barrel fold metal-dependent hydrolase